jgi:hypothetical protein
MSRAESLLRWAPGAHCASFLPQTCKHSQIDRRGQITGRQTGRQACWLISCHAILYTKRGYFTKTGSGQT